MKQNVAILLSTYNSSQFLRDQIESIINQSYDQWTLHIRDDGSIDRTVEIIDEYVNLYPDKIKYYSDISTNIGACKSFYLLLEQVQADYFMFCDHDDIWMQNKIELSYKKMIETENKYNYEKPIIIHTDMVVVDSNLNVICNSFWSYLRLNPKFSSFCEILVSQNVNGCTMIMNNLAKTVAIPNKSLAHMHDIGITLSVSNVDGIIEYIEDKTVLYRQHVNNQVGAKKVNLCYFLKRMNNLHALFLRNKACYKNGNRYQRISISKYLYFKLKIFLYKTILYKYDNFKY
jgi:glycosyltransferase involved in cell wall biosynthesis